MAKHIDLSSVLSTERPTITINGNKYTVKDEKTNVLLMNNEMAKNGADLGAIDKIITILLGKKAQKEIDAMGFGLSQYMTIFYALVATVNDEDLEVVKERFQNQRSQ